MKNTKTNKWEPTKIGGIRRHVSTGGYYFQKKIAGTVFGGSLETTDFVAAKLKFAEKLGELAKSANTLGKPDALTRAQGEAVTLGDVAALFISRVNGGGYGTLSQKTKDKRDYQLRTLKASWASVPEFAKHGLTNFDAVRAHTITYDQLIAWRKHFLTHAQVSKANAAKGKTKGYSADYYNKTLQIVRALFDIASEKGSPLARSGAENKTAIERLASEAVQRKEYTLPTAEVFAKILEANIHHNGKSRHCRDLLEGISYTGLRKEEAASLNIKHVELDRNLIRLPAALCKGREGKKKGRIIPILPDAQPLFTRLVRDATTDGEVFHVGEATDWLKASCKATGWKEKFTLHSARHYFATRCLEAGIPVQTVASYLGHRDKGKLLLEVYAHICEKHALEAAEHIHGWKNVQTPVNVVDLAKVA